MLFKKETAWVVVADGASANIYEKENSRHLTLLQQYSSETSHKLTRELVSDRPGRTFESYGMARHAKESRSDPQAMEKEKFIRSVADHINAAELEGKFDALILCAPPRVLGKLRQLLDKNTQKLVKAEIGKDFVKTPIKDLLQLIKTPEKE
jgi:protein required for attachment to host cells